MNRKPCVFVLALASLLASPSAASAQETPLNAVFDSAAVLSALAQLPSRPPEFRSVFHLHYGPAGALDSISPAGGMPRAYADSMLALLRQHARPEAAGLGGRELRVRVHGGPTPVLLLSHLSPSSQNPPQLQNPYQARQELIRLAERLRRERNEREETRPGVYAANPHAGQPRRYQTTFKFRIDTEGRVGEIEVQQRSGDPELDRELGRVLRRLRFQPALIDGAPVVVWAHLPMEIYL